jgi:hypothetical protein
MPVEVIFMKLSVLKIVANLFKKRHMDQVQLPAPNDASADTAASSGGPRFPLDPTLDSPLFSCGTGQTPCSFTGLRKGH